MMKIIWTALNLYSVHVFVTLLLREFIQKRMKNKLFQLFTGVSHLSSLWNLSNIWIIQTVSLYLTDCSILTFINLCPPVFLFLITRMNNKLREKYSCLLQQSHWLWTRKTIQKIVYSFFEPHCLIYLLSKMTGLIFF